MNIKKKRLTIIIMFISMMFCACGVSQNYEYAPPGRDTVEIFGNGRYEIGSTTSPIGDYKTYGLVDKKSSVQQVEGMVLIYKQYENYVYVIGLIGKEGQYEAYEEEVLTLKKMPKKLIFTKLNYESGDLWQSDKLSDFSDADKDIFWEELRSEETLYE